MPARTGPVRLRATARRANDSADIRQFGICLTHITLDDTPIALDSKTLGPGFHPPESNGTQSWRWTTAEAWLVLPYSPTPRTLHLTLTDWHHNLAPA